MLNCDEMMEMFHYMEDKNIILSIDLADGNTQVQEMKEIIQECPQLKSRYRTFRYGYNSSLAGTNKTGPAYPCHDRVRRHYLVVQQ